MLARAICYWQKKNGEGYGTLRQVIHASRLGPSASHHCPGAHVSIFFGSSWSDRSSPWPRQASSPSPQVKTALSAVTAVAVVAYRRGSDDTLASKGLDLRRLPLGLLVAVAQLAKASLTPAPNGAVGGEGEAVATSNRHAHSALVTQR